MLHAAEASRVQQSFNREIGFGFPYVRCFGCAQHDVLPTGNAVK